MPRYFNSGSAGKSHGAPILQYGGYTPKGSRVYRTLKAKERMRQREKKERKERFFNKLFALLREVFK